MTRPDISLGATGEDVIELHRYLRGLGYRVGSDAAHFDSTTEEAVRSFQTHRRLDVDGVCASSTWSVLVEAQFTLGSRLIYLTSPMLRGDDVIQLQHHLGSLGFDPGRTDGIFGPDSQRAVNTFQTNVGIVADSVVGPNTVTELERFVQTDSTTSIAGIRELEALRAQKLTMTSLSVALCCLNSESELVELLTAGLEEAGATVQRSVGSTWSEVARTTKTRSVDVCIGIANVEHPACECSFFETEGFTSFGGKALASLMVEEFPQLVVVPPPIAIGGQTPLLRETTVPAVRLKIGPADELHDNSQLVAAGLQRALQTWTTAKH